MTAPLSRESVERMMALCEKATPGFRSWGAKYVCQKLDGVSVAARMPIAQCPDDEYDSEQWNRDAELIAACDPQTILALCQHYLSTMDRGDTAVRGEAVAWVTPLRFGEQVTFYKPPKPDYWEDCDEDEPWYCKPLFYASPPATPVAAGGDGRVVSDAMVEALRRARYHVLSQNRAERMLDGFGPKSVQASDADLELIDRVLAEAASPVAETFLPAIATSGLSAMGEAAALEAAERTSNEMPSAAVTDADLIVGLQLALCQPDIDEVDLDTARKHAQLIADRRKAALAAAPGGKS